VAEVAELALIINLLQMAAENPAKQTLAVAGAGVGTLVVAQLKVATAAQVLLLLDIKNQ
jgi:threonine dehydrogenase-like Zn-dependent dehydrogenase